MRWRTSSRVGAAADTTVQVPGLVGVTVRAAQDLALDAGVLAVTYGAVAYGAALA